MSRLRANQITNENANGAPNFPHGLTVTGVVTATTSATTMSQIVVGSAVTANSQGIDVTGIVTATSFHGDISQATGAAAGLGTALSQTQTDPLNKVYFTDNILEFSSTTTIDHPPSTNTAYTNYSDIKISGSADLIIKDGDEFIPDVLGLSTTSMRGRLTYN